MNILKRFIDSQNKMSDNLSNIFRSEVIVDIGDEIIDSYIELLAKEFIQNKSINTSDVIDDIHWFIWENNMGKKGFSIDREKEYIINNINNFYKYLRIMY